MKKVFYWIMVGVILFTSTVPLYAKSLTELRKEREELQSSLKNSKSELDETNQQKSQALKDIDAIDVELNEVSLALNVIEDDLNQTTELLEQNQKELADAEALREEQYELLKQRARFMYENSKGGYIQVALEAQNISDFLNRVEYMNRIIEYDQNIVETLTQTEELIAVKVEETDRQKKEMEILKDQHEKKIQNLEETLAKKEQTIEQLRASETKIQQYIDDLQAEDEKIEQLIRDAAAKAYATSGTVQYTGGRVTWPLPGKYGVSSEYGSRNSPISGKGEFHTGLDIPAGTGTTIHSGEAGVVIQAGWTNGYGYTVVIDHGGALGTMYAHCSQLLVSVGDVVERGSVIAKVGSTGYSTGPHLHFEVRINGKHQNPRNYVS